MKYLKIFFNLIFCLFVFLILNFKCSCSQPHDYYIDINNKLYLTFSNDSKNPINFNLLVPKYGLNKEIEFEYKSLLLNKNDNITYIVDNTEENNDRRINNSEEKNDRRNLINKYYIYNFFDEESNIRFSEGWLNTNNYFYNEGQNSELLDTSLNFIKNEVDSDKDCYFDNSRRATLYHKCKNHKASFNNEDYIVPSSTTQNFRLINNLNFDILVKVYKIMGHELNIKNLQIKNYLPNNYNTTFSWQTSIESRAIETIFQSDINYSGPFLIEIYNKNDSSLILKDFIKNIFNESKLIWFAKEDTPTTILSSSLKNKSDYPYEFYTEIHTASFK